MANTHETIFKAFDDDEHLIFGEVYSPLKPDSDGDIMDAATIKKMAHDFLKAHKLDQIDVQHDNNLNPGASIVESFIARKGDPVFIEGSWVVGMHIPDNDTWKAIKSGEINGFSMEAMVTKTPMELEIDIPPVVNGKTTVTKTGANDDGHEHEFFVTFDHNGKFMGGRTSITKGHFHTIRAGTATDMEQGHNHRFSFVEAFSDPTQVAQITKAAEDASVVEEAAPKDLGTTQEIVEAQPQVIAKETNTETLVTSAPESMELTDKDHKLAIKSAVKSILKAEAKGIALEDAIKEAVLAIKGDASKEETPKETLTPVQEVLKSLGVTGDLFTKDQADSFYTEVVEKGCIELATPVSNALTKVYHHPAMGVLMVNKEESADGVLLKFKNLS